MDRVYMGYAVGMVVWRFGDGSRFPWCRRSAAVAIFRSNDVAVSDKSQITCLERRLI